MAEQGSCSINSKGSRTFPLSKYAEFHILTKNYRICPKISHTFFEQLKEFFFTFLHIAVQEKMPQNGALVDLITFYLYDITTMNNIICRYLNVSCSFIVLENNVVAFWSLNLGSIHLLL